MKQLSKKGVMLFAAAMALCAFAMPSIASASSWGPVGTEHKLDTSDFGFVSHSLSASSMCADAQFTVIVSTTAAIEVIMTGFFNCTYSTGGSNNCRATVVGTSLPWTATAVSTNNIQIHGMHVNVYLEGHAGGSCGAEGQTIRLTGTLSGAKWLGNTNDPRIELAGGTGLVAHTGGFFDDSTPITTTGTLTDTSGATNPITVTG